MENDPYIVPEAAPIIILDSKYAVFMANNGRDTKYTGNISRRVHYFRNGENANCKRLTGVK